MNLKQIWQEKYKTGKIFYDEELSIIIPSANSKNWYSWGTVFYSEARENYKTQIKNNKSESKPTFDLYLMKQLELTKFESLIVAANPNSLFEGHLVIYPEVKHMELNYRDIYDLTALAFSQPEITFIHNMERAAASILDWVHYQAYPLIFPIENEKYTVLDKLPGIKISKINPDFPTYSIVAESSDADALTVFIEKILELLKGENNPQKQRIACNLIWRKNKVWIIPRAKDQTVLAETYIGALEMGGIFCLPNADDFRKYLPNALRQEIISSSIFCEPETQKWFEENAIKILCGKI